MVKPPKFGAQLLDALPNFVNVSRLNKGRAYGTSARIKSYGVSGKTITAQIKGNISAHFGVYQEPMYTTTIEFEPLPPKNWQGIIKRIQADSAMVAQVMAGDLPKDIEALFKAERVTFMPKNQLGFETTCTCPDYANPCKHVVGLYYFLADLIDADPWLLFELRGMARVELQKNLAQTRVAKALLGTTVSTDKVVAATSLYTRPIEHHPAPLPSYAEFWLGATVLPELAPVQTNKVAALLIKKQGDNPKFWRKSESFIVTMEEIYNRMKNQNNDLI